MITIMRRTTRVLLVPLSILFFAYPFASSNADNRFQEHRLRVQQGQMKVASVRGLVVDAVGDDRLITDITPQALAEQSIEDSDLVTLTVGKETMRARVMSARAFSEMVNDSSARDNLDVDIVCLLAPARMEIVGLGGGLVEWLDPNKRMPVVIEKEYY